eukprot:5189245-Amphidinium_carterae.2
MPGLAAMSSAVNTHQKRPVPACIDEQLRLPCWSGATSCSPWSVFRVLTSYLHGKSVGRALAAANPEAVLDNLNRFATVM